MSDQYTMQDPTTQYPGPDESFEQQQEGPGLQGEMAPKPDSGESSYRGSGRLEGRRAVVTGADSGIGRATAIAYAREGADVVLSYLPQEEPDAREVVELIEAAGRRAVAVPGDVTDKAYCEQLIATAVAELGGIDILANIAGKQQHCPDILELTDEQFDETYKTNVYAMFWLCKAAVPPLPPGSAIINTCSWPPRSPATSAGRPSPRPAGCPRPDRSGRAGPAPVLARPPCRTPRHRVPGLLSGTGSRCPGSRSGSRPGYARPTVPCEETHPWHCPIPPSPVTSTT